MQQFKKIVIALVVLAILALVYALVNRKEKDYTAPPRDVVFAEFRAKITPSAIGSITVSGEKDKQLVISKKDNEWVLPALYDYPADKKFVNELIVDLMKLGEERLEATNSASHPNYEVDAEKGKKLALADTASKDIGALVIGKSVFGSMNRGFMRIDGKDEVYSVVPALSWKLKTYGDNWSKNWLNSTLVEFDKDKGEDVSKIEVIRADGERFTIEKVEEEKPIEEPKPDATASEEKKDEAPKTVKETKWYVVAANGERFEADSSARSSFTGQFDRLAGTDPVKPAPLADYGLEPAYLTLKVTTSFTKEEFKSEKPKTYEILVGAQVPEETKEEAPKVDAAPAPAPEAPKADAPPAPAPAEAPKADAPPAPAPAEAPKADAPPAPAPTPDAPSAPATSTDSGKSSAADDAPAPAPVAPPVTEPPPPPAAPPATEPAPTPVAPPVTEPPPPALPPTELPPATPVASPGAEAPKAETPAAAPAPAEPPKPKFKTDRYVTVRGDRRIMTIAEWKLKSIDKKAADFKPKKEEPKKEEPKPDEAGPPAPPAPPAAEAPKTGEVAPVQPAPAPAPTPPETPAPPPAPAEPAPAAPPASPAEKPTAVEYGARHILISYQGKTGDPSITRTKEDADKKAKEILTELQKDKSKFAELATQWSDCPSKKDGGDLGTFGEGQMVAAFENALKTLKVGDISGVVETEFGFHIIERTK